MTFIWHGITQILEASRKFGFPSRESGDLTLSSITSIHNRFYCPYTIWYKFCSADAQYNTATINTNVIVEYTGEVTWLSHGMFKSSCDISVEYFPFDIQDCHLKWASWTYDGFVVSIISRAGSWCLKIYLLRAKRKQYKELCDWNYHILILNIYFLILIKKP